MGEEAKQPFEELAKKDLDRYHAELEQFEVGDPPFPRVKNKTKINKDITKKINN